MAYLEITVHTTGAQIAAVADALTGAGFDDLLIEDEAELSEFLEQNRTYWDYVDPSVQEKLHGLSQIRLYLPETDRPGLARLQSLLETLRRKGLGDLPMTSAPLKDTDWSESWKENYPPQPVGKDMIVIPYWMADTDTSGKKQIILDPGLTFGTGAHPSTQMVMEAMEDILRPGDRCLDLGSGSGILSITALRLGASSAVGVDIDPKAADAAARNAAYNGFGAPEFSTVTGNLLTDRPLLRTLCASRYDLVLLNIVADVIISLAPVLPELLSGGNLICSGILDTRLQDVLSALEKAGAHITSIRAKAEWRCVCAVSPRRDSP